MRHATKWLICFTALGAVSMPSLARNWYFSTSSGSDGAWFNTSSTPWSSLSMLTSQSLSAGDTINLKCGDVWRESLDFTSAWVSGAITVQSWPVDCSNKPSIRGSDAKTSVTWQSGGTANVYKTAWTGASVPAQLFVNGEQFILARYPNANGNPNNYAIAASAVASAPSLTLSATDKANVLANASDVAGARVLIRSQQWVVETRSASTYDGTTGVLQLNQATQYGLQAQDGFLLENKRWMIDSAKEWFYDSTGWLYAQPATGTSLSTSNIELTVRPYILRVYGVPGFTIRNIDLRHAKVNALQIIDSSNATVDKVTVSYAGVAGNDCMVTGVYVGPDRNGLSGGCATTTAPANSAGAKVTNSVFAGNGESSIYVESGGAQIEGNQITDSGLLAFTRNALAAVRVKGAGASIKNNAITRSAYDAIEFGNAGETIESNVINTYCVRYMDCGAIYAYNGGTNQTAPTVLSQGPSYVRNNYIVVGTGDLQGTSKQERNLVSGIYLDSFTNNVTVSGNAIDEAGIGVYLHGAYQNKVQNNWVKGARRAGLLASDGVGGGGYVRANTVSGNYFHAYNRFLWAGANALPLKDAGVAQEWYHSTDPTKLFIYDGTLPGASLPSTADRRPGNTVSGNVAVNADNKTTQWRLASSNADYYSHDVSLGTWKASSLATDTVQPIWPVRLVRPAALGGVSTSAAVIQSDFSTSLSPWFMQGGAANGTASLVTAPGTAGTPGAACTTNCASISFLSSGDAYYNGDFTLPSSASSSVYYVEYMVAGADGSMANVNLPYDSWTKQAFGVKDGTKSYELGTGTSGQNEVRWFEGFFKPSVLPTQAGIAVYGRAGTSIALDDVKLVEFSSLAQADLYAPSPNARLIYNTGTSTLTVSCPFTSCVEWKDEAGTLLSAGASISVPAGGKKMVFNKPASGWLRP